MTDVPPTASPGDHLRRAYSELFADLVSSAAGALLFDRAQQFGRELGLFVEIAELSLLRYQLLFEEAPEPYVVTDADGVVTEANTAALALLSVDDHRLIGRELRSFVAQEDRREYEQWLLWLQTGRPEARWEARITGADGESILVEIRLADDLEGIGYRWQLHDQRRRAAVERELRETVDEERGRIDTLHREARVRADFLLALSHHLRAPIGALVHQADLLGRHALSDDLRARSVQAMADNAGVLTELLEDLIDIERMADLDATDRRTPCAVVELVESLDDPGIDAAVDGNAVTFVDFSLMRRTLRRLVREVRRQGGTDRVRLSAHADGAEVVIAIDPIDPAMADPQARSTVGRRLVDGLVDLQDATLADADTGGFRLRVPSASGGGEKP